MLPFRVSVWQATLSKLLLGERGGASPANELKQATQPIQPLISGQWAMRMLDQAVTEEGNGGELVLTTPFTNHNDPQCLTWAPL